MCIPVVQQVVSDMAEPIIDQGHVVYFDSAFACRDCVEDLANKQTGACGILCVTHVGIPEAIKKAKLNSGDPPLVIVEERATYIVWFDKRMVYFITSVHNGATFSKVIRSRPNSEHVREVDKPVAIQQYLKVMAGVDRAEKALSFYMVFHRLAIIM